MSVSDSFSLPRRVLLAPAALAYAAGAALHRAWMRAGARARPPEYALPVVVIGSLRAGGAGKTPVARALARHLAARGLRVGILAYAIGKRPTDAADEVSPDDDWRATSDEAVLLARGLRDTGARVFVTRHRARARAALARTGAFDVLVSDDGLMDERLGEHGVFRVVIAGKDERPGLFDLLPAGPYRLTAAFLERADHVLQPGDGFVREATPGEALTPGNPPHGLLPHWLLCGLGNPAALRASLGRLGVRIAGMTVGPDHGLPDLGRAKREAMRAGVGRYLCTEKDAIKLENHPECPEPLLIVGESVTLSGAFIRAVDDFLATATS